MDLVFLLYVDRFLNNWLHLICQMIGLLYSPEIFSRKSGQLAISCHRNNSVHWIQDSKSTISDPRVGFLLQICPFGLRFGVWMWHVTVEIDFFIVTSEYVGGVKTLHTWQIPVVRFHFDRVAEVLYISIPGSMEENHRVRLARLG